MASIKRVLWFAALHYIVVLALAGIIFLAIHLPPKAIHLDPVIEGLVAIENVPISPFNRSPMQSSSSTRSPRGTT